MRWPQFIGEIMGADTGGEYEEFESLNPFEAKPSLVPELEIEDQEMETARIIRCCEKNCLENLPQLRSTEHRSKFLELSKRDQRLLLIGILIRSYSKDLPFEYKFERKYSVCEEAFRYLHAIGPHTLKALQASVSLQDFRPPEHGNTGKKSGAPSSKIAILDFFIDNYLEIHSLPSYGRMRSGIVETFLPGDITIAKIWSEYMQAIEEVGYKKAYVTYDFFKEYISYYRPHVRFQKERSDLCGCCEEIKGHLILEKEEKREISLLKEYQAHKKSVSQALSEYKKQINFSRESWLKLDDTFRASLERSLSNYPKLTPGKACRSNCSMHYSFDFTQQIHYPYSPQQKGSEYFTSSRKCRVFGVTCEPIGRSVLFLLDEEEFSKEGADSVISYLDTFFLYHGVGEKRAFLHANDCSSHSKNNAVIWYLSWRTMAKLHKKINLSFMVDGHTKFAPDSTFGLFKLQYRRHTVDCLADLEEPCRRASKTGRIITHFLGEHLKDENKEQILFKQWTSFLGKYFKSVPSISKYRYFEFSHKKPGVVFVRESENEKKKEIFILKDPYVRFSDQMQPQPEILKGLDLERQSYLYKSVRKFVRDPAKRDISCPKPFCFDN